MCTTTFLAMVDPGKVPACTAQLRRGITIAWPKVLDNVRVSAEAGSPKAKWNAVTGPIAAVIATLVDACWVPLDPATWVDTGGQTWQNQW